MKLKRVSWKAVRFHFWMWLGMVAVRGMGRNSELHKRAVVANRVMHTVRSGNMEVVVSWMDLTKPGGFSLEEEQAMRNYIQQREEGKQPWPLKRAQR